MRDTKLGLALSGGGFRAALFHIGVMAQLARRQILPHVDVLSTVSGGSILGAYYVLRLERELVEHGGVLDPMDYVSLMHEIEHEFLQAVQKNIRMRTFSNPLKSLKMIRPTYSRSDRIGELLDRFFFEPGLTGEVGSRRSKVEMRRLGELEAERNGVIPHLVVNATSLNTGHAWRFTGTTMGEWPPSNQDEWDFNRSAFFAMPPSYGEMVPELAAISMGKAVAASAAVPGLFQPLQVTYLFEDDVQLVDGGVFDNQGIDALIDERCTHVILSDAGGQMQDVRRAPSWMVGSVLRSAGVQYGRVRELGLERVRSRYGPQRLALIHTRRGVRPPTRPWRNQAGILEGVPDARLPRKEQSPVHPEIQELLADIRTDLDNFNDVEGRSLMLSGYLLADQELAEMGGELASAPPLSIEDFAFEKLRPLMSEAARGRFKKLLAAGRIRVYKFLKLRPAVALVLAPFVYGPVLAAVVLLILASLHFGPELVAKIPYVGDRITSGLAGIKDFLAEHSLRAVVAAFLGGLALSYLLAKTAVTRRLPSAFAGGKYAPCVSKVARSAVLVSRAVAALVGVLFVWLSMLIYDPLYRRAGKVGKVLPGPNE